MFCAVNLAGVFGFQAKPFFPSYNNDTMTTKMKPKPIRMFFSLKAQAEGPHMLAVFEKWKKHVH